MSITWHSSSCWRCQWWPGAEQSCPLQRVTKSHCCPAFLGAHTLWTTSNIGKGKQQTNNNKERFSCEQRQTSEKENNKQTSTKKDFPTTQTAFEIRTQELRQKRYSDLFWRSLTNHFCFVSAFWEMLHMIQMVSITEKYDGRKTWAKAGVFLVRLNFAKKIHVYI